MEVPDQPSNHETAEQRPPPAFRFDLMTDDQICILSRLVTEACDSFSTGSGDMTDSELSELEQVEELLQDSLEGFGCDHPERAIPLFKSLLTSTVDAVLDTGSKIAKGIATHNLELAVDGLLAAEARHLELGQGPELEMAILSDIRRDLSPEQRTWFDAKLALWEEQNA